jgi:hypothetical protein
MTRDLEWHENKKLRRMEVAAPRMLEALKAIIECDAESDFDGLCDGIGPEPFMSDKLSAALELAMDAIAAAEGEA